MILQCEVQYPWDKIPAQFKFAAVDPNGNLWAYTHQPELGKDGWHEGISLDYLLVCCYVTNDEKVLNWQASLEQRPQHTFHAGLFESQAGENRWCQENQGRAFVQVDPLVTIPDVYRICYVALNTYRLISEKNHTCWSFDDVFGKAIWKYAS